MTLRLAVNPGALVRQAFADNDAAAPCHEAPAVRLAVPDARQCTEALARGVAEDPTLRLAHCVGAQGDRPLMQTEQRPALLISYVYLAPFLQEQARLRYRDWVLDSGAFSAFKSGEVIELEAYAATCQELLAKDRTLTEVFSLDVIDNWRAGVKNTERLWALGVPAIPCFHPGEPWELLEAMARDYPKIALGGVALAVESKKLAWAGQCFARVWPKRIHGFAFSSERALMTYPWASVDASSWEAGPCVYGNWRGLGGKGSHKVSVRGSAQRLEVEIAWYLKLEARARRKWGELLREIA